MTRCGPVAANVCRRLCSKPTGCTPSTRSSRESKNALAGNDAIPIAVGAGSINDLTKLAAHLCGRQYLSVATAASMDGYTAFGASITHEGSKQTFDCPRRSAWLPIWKSSPPRRKA